MEKETDDAYVENRDVGITTSDHVNFPLPNEFIPNTSKNGLILVPQPSDDPKDPLNWPTRKKFLTLAIVSFASYVGNLVGLSNTAGFFQQAAAYNKSPGDIANGLSAAVAGLAVGPLLWSPLSKAYGRCAVIFWSMILSLGVAIWGARMTNKSDYEPFIVSRLFAGMFGSASTTVGANIIVEVFFLHDRGKALAFYATLSLLAPVSAGTFSGFIVNETEWPVEFWYCVGLTGFVAILCFLFLDETGWTRSGTGNFPLLPESFLARKLATYFFTQRTMPYRTPKEVGKLAILPFIIMLQPPVIVVGSALLIIFAWSVGVTTFLSIFLQSPLEEGGYAFTPLRNAAFTFTQWVGVFAGQAYGQVFADRIPLYFCSRNGGQWHPEYRLHSLWVPVLFIYPIGLGIFGATLFYHWHYMALAFGAFTIQFSTVSAVPVCFNYVIEALGPSLANEATAAMNFYRLILGLSISFFLNPWTKAVGIQWVFGMMAFFTILAFGLILVAIMLGKKLRAGIFVHVGSKDEDGVTVLDKSEIASKHP